MRVVCASLTALLAAGTAAHARSPMRLSVRPERPRCYGGETVTVRVRGPKGCDSIRWVGWVAGAKICEGEAPLEESSAAISVRMPGVERATTVSVVAEETTTEWRYSGSCSVRVFPQYDGSRLKRLFGPGRTGVAEVRDEISSHLAPFDCRYEKAGGRLALRFFEGDVLVASGAWWAGEGRFVAALLRGHLGRGVRIVVLECAGGGLSFAAAPKSRCSEGLVFADPRHHVSRAPGLDSGWGEVPALVLDLAGNLRRVLVGADNDLPVIVESFPPEGGALLRVSLPVLSRFDRDPAAPILFERCLAHAIEAKPPRWKPVALRLGDANGLAERLAELGMTGAAELPDDRKAVLFLAAPRLTQEARRWAESGGTAVVLVPGTPDSAWVAKSDDAALCGITRSLARRLRAADRDGDAWEEIEIGAERRVLASGLLDRVELGDGKAYVLRVGPLDEEMTRPWREFLLQVLTNLGVKCGEVDARE